MESFLKVSCKLMFLFDVDFQNVDVKVGNLNREKKLIFGFVGILVHLLDHF